MLLQIELGDNNKGALLGNHQVKMVIYDQMDKAGKVVSSER